MCFGGVMFGCCGGGFMFGVEVCFLGVLYFGIEFGVVGCQNCGVFVFSLFGDGYGFQYLFGFDVVFGFLYYLVFDLCFFVCQCFGFGVVLYVCIYCIGGVCFGGFVQMCICEYVVFGIVLQFGGVFGFFFGLSVQQ